MRITQPVACAKACLKLCAILTPRLVTVAAVIFRRRNKQAAELHEAHLFFSANAAYEPKIAPKFVEVQSGEGEGEKRKEALSVRGAMWGRR